MPTALRLRLAVPHIAARRQRAIADLRHIAQKHRAAQLDADHQIGHVLRLSQKRAGLDSQGLVSAQKFAHWQAQIGRLQRTLQVGHRDVGARHARWV